MNYNDFLTRQQQIKKLSIAEQKNFYEQLLKKKYDKTEVRILASFYYGQLFYQEGNFMHQKVENEQYIHRTES